MGKGIDIPIGADASGVVRASKQIEGSLEDVIDALTDVGDQSQDTERVTEKSLKDIGDTAETQADRLTRDFTKALEQVEDKSKTAGKRIGKSVKAGTDEASDGLDTMKQEAGQTARESAASFGGVEDALDAVQELAANAFEDFGTGGMIAGIAVAAGIGLAISALQAADERALALREKMIDLAAEITDAGGDIGRVDIAGKIREWGDEITNQKSWWEVWQKQTTTNMEDVQTKAADLGITFTDLFRGLSGFDQAAARRSIGEIDAALAREEATVADLTDATKLHTEADVAAAAVAETRITALTKQRDELAASNRLTDEAIERDETYARVLGEGTTAAQAHAEATEDLAEALRSASDPVTAYQDLLTTKETAERETAQATADATKDASDSWEDYAKDVTVSIDDLIDEMNRQAEEAESFEANLAVIASRGGQAVADELRAKGPEVAGATAALLATTSEPKFSEYMTARGRVLGGDVATGMSAGLTSQEAETAVESAVRGLVTGFPVPEIKVPVKPDKLTWDTAMRNLMGQSWSQYVNVVPRPGTAAQG